jgi:hypothetical protein
MHVRKRRGWWEALTTEDGLPPPEVLVYDEYTFQFMGIENEEERLGKAESGESDTTNMKSPSQGALLIGKGTNESDYTSFTLAFPTIKFPGSYAFTVAMWNGVSE